VADATHFNAKTLTDEAGAESDYEVMNVDSLAALRERDARCDVVLVAQELADEVANDESTVPLRTSFVRSRNLKCEFVADSEVPNAAAHCREAGDSDVLCKTGQAARAVGRGHVQIDVAVNVDSGLDPLEDTDSLSEVGEIPLHSFDVDAHSGEVSLEGGCHSLKVGDVIAVSTHGCYLIFKSLKLSSQGCHFLLVAAGDCADCVDLVLKAHDHASKLLVGSIDRACELVA